MAYAKLQSSDFDEFHASLERCTASPGFLERFYRSFLAASPEVKDKFRNTNWLRQYRMMVASFHLMSLAAEHETNGDSHLHRIARSHGKSGHMIPPELYDVWLTSLLEAVSETDPEFNDQIEALWRNVMGRGIDFMRNNAQETPTT